MKKRCLSTIVVSVCSLIITCTSSQSQIQAPQKPIWINEKPTGTFLGVAEAISEEQARLNSQSNALSQIRLSVHGGKIISMADMEILENEQGVKETYKLMSKLSVEGYVQGTTVRSYVEEDFSGRELIFRCYTLMAFDYGRYQKYLLEQTNAVTRLLEQIYASPVILTPAYSESDFSDLFRKIKVTDEVLSAVVEAAGKMNSNSELIQADEEFSELVNILLGKVEITPQKNTVVSNPYQVFDISSPIKFRLKDSKRPLSRFPYTVYKGSEVLASSFTGVNGQVEIPRDQNWEPGEEYHLTVGPAVKSLSVVEMPHAALNVKLDYRLQLNVALDSKVRSIDTGDLAKQIPGIFESKNISVHSNEADGLLIGSISINPSSTLYGLFYAEASAVLTLQPDKTQSDRIEYMKSATSEGNSYDTAGAEAFYSIMEEIGTQIQDDLRNNVK